MKLTSMMMVVSHFISELGKNELLFSKLLKKADKSVGNDEVCKAFEELKHLSPILPS
jgi:hypothetical protein